MGGVWCSLVVPPFPAVDPACENKKTVPEFKQVCKDKGIKGFSTMKRDELRSSCCALTPDDIVKRWNASTWQRPEGWNDDRGRATMFPKIDANNIRVNDGKVSIGISEEEDTFYWNGMMEEYSYKGVDAIARFLGQFMQRGSETTFKTRVDIDSTGTKEKNTYSVKKGMDGRVEKNLINSDFWDPDS